MSWIKTIIRMPGRQKGMILAVLYLSAKYRWMLRNLPFRKFAKDLGNTEGSALEEYSDAQKQTMIDVRTVVEKVCNHTPWKSECLVRAFVAKQLLSKCHVSCVVYLGVCNSESGKMLAHAWVCCGDYFVTGQPGYERFTVTSRFYS